MITILDTAEDLQWLKDVHVPPADMDLMETCVAAVLHGNEDAPDRIDLYDADDVGSCYATLYPRCTPVVWAAR